MTTHRGVSHYREGKSGLHIWASHRGYSSQLLSKGLGWCKINLQSITEDGPFKTLSLHLSKKKVYFALAMKYNRILLKLSGEALMGDKQFGIDNKRLAQYAADIKSIAIWVYR